MGRGAVSGRSPQRLLAIDAMRGLTIALMIMVNNPLWGTGIFTQLEHTAWNGLTIADLVFPWFMFIMGISVALSMRRYGFCRNRTVVSKILRRTVLIFVVGLALDFLEKGISGVIEGLDFSNLRLTGVLPRLALSYGIAALLTLFVPLRGLKWGVVAMLGVYAVILLLFKGYEPSTDNIVSRIDVAILGESHMYHDWVPQRIALDPEGLLGTLPSVAHVLIGYIMGRMLVSVAENEVRVGRLMLYGAVIALAGYLLSVGLPVNKKIWSPTFVLLSCGLGAQLLGILIWLIDIRGYRSWTPLVTVFGVNPLFLYVFSSIIGTVAWQIAVGEASLPAWLYDRWLMPLFGTSSCMPSLVYSLLTVAVCWIVGYPLWKHKIYIKL